MRALAAALALAALVVVTVGWLQSPDELTRAEAVASARSAFAAAGLRDAVIDPTPTKGRYVTAGDPDGVDVWKTSARLDGGSVELWLARSDGESVFLDDRAPDGSSQLLTDRQFRQLAEHYDNPAVSRQVRRNVVLTLGAALVALLAVRLGVAATQPGALRRPHLRRPQLRRPRLRSASPPRSDRGRLLRRRRGAVPTPSTTATPAADGTVARPPRRERPLRAKQETW